MSAIKSITKFNLHFHAYNAIRKNEIALDIKKEKGTQTALDRQVHRLGLAAFYLYELAESAVPTLLYLGVTVITLPVTLLPLITCVVSNVIAKCCDIDSVEMITDVALRIFAFPHLFNCERIHGIYTVLASLQGTEVPRLDSNMCPYYFSCEDEDSLLFEAINPFLKKLVDDDTLDEAMLKRVSKVLLKYPASLSLSPTVVAAFGKIIDKHGLELMRVAPDLLVLVLDNSRSVPLAIRVKILDLFLFSEEDLLKFFSRKKLLQELMTSNSSEAISYLKEWVAMIPSEMSLWLEKNQTIVISSECAQAVTEIEWPLRGCLKVKHWKRLQSTFPNLKTITIPEYNVKTASEFLHAWGNDANDVECKVNWWTSDASKLWKSAQENPSSVHLSVLKQFGLDKDSDMDLIEMAFTGKGSVETLSKMANHLNDCPYAPFQQGIETDFEIKAENSDDGVKVHKALICLCSEYFLEQIDFGLEDATDHTLRVEHGASLETIKVIVDCCYAQESTIPEGVDARDVLKLANYLGIQPIKDYAEDVLIAEFKETGKPTKQQIVETLEFAKAFFCERLETAVNALKPQ